MSFSAHRPGKFGSDGQIEFESSVDLDEPMYVSTPENGADLLNDWNVFGPDESDVTSDPEPAAPVVAEAPAPAEPAAAETAPIEETPVLAATRAARVKRERPRANRMRQLAILGGANGAVLDDVPIETSRFVQMFFVLAGTALVSGISMFFALTNAVRVVPYLAVLLAIVWMLIIFNLDRFLTSSMRSTRNGWKLAGLAAPRVLMAAIIGIVVAEPLVLQVFHNDIQREVNATNITQSQSDQDALETGPEKKAMDAASERLSALENQAATGIVAGTSNDSAAMIAAQATVDDVQAKMDAQQVVIDKARAIYECELTGVGAGEVEGCTGAVGEGASSEAAYSQLQSAQAVYDDLSKQLQNANDDLAKAETNSRAEVTASESTNRQEAQDALPAARETYNTARDAYNARAASVAEGNSGAVGLLSQIGAMERLSAKEPVLGWAHWLIAALFFLIELLPVLVKVLTSWGDPSIYEKAESMRRQVSLDSATAKTWRERAVIAEART